MTKLMNASPNRRIALVACVVAVLDQFTKYLVIQFLKGDEQKVIIEGFFKLVHWTNTGAAWSLFTNRNGLLAAVAIVALFLLFRTRHHFDAHTGLGQVALGLIFGGIVGNLIDRVRIGHVTDFLYFYLRQRGGEVLGFPAFNVADSAICIGVALIFISSWKSEKTPASPAQPAA